MLVLTRLRWVGRCQSLEPYDSHTSHVFVPAHMASARGFHLLEASVPFNVLLSWLIYVVLRTVAAGVMVVPQSRVQVVHNLCADRSLPDARQIIASLFSQFLSRAGRRKDREKSTRDLQ